MKRAALAAPALFLAVVLLVNFKGPAETAIAVTNDTGNRVASAGGSSAGLIGGAASGSGTGSSGSGSGPGSGSGSGASGSSGSAAGTGSSGSGAGSSGSGGSISRSPKPGTFPGQDISMPYGDVQVQVTIQGGRITDIKTLSMPIGGHSGRIAQIVAPMLRSEALTAQSANIDIISGATYTSEAYAMSLQSALDAAAR